jgi:hypothetical protein
MKSQKKTQLSAKDLKPIRGLKTNIKAGFKDWIKA